MHLWVSLPLRRDRYSTIGRGQRFGRIQITPLLFGTVKPALVASVLTLLMASRTHTSHLTSSGLFSSPARHRTSGHLSSSAPLNLPSPLYLRNALSKDNTTSSKLCHRHPARDNVYKKEHLHDEKDSLRMEGVNKLAIDIVGVTMNGTRHNRDISLRIDAPPVTEARAAFASQGKTDLVGMVVLNAWIQAMEDSVMDGTVRMIQ